MELKHILEAILFSAQKPMSAPELQDVLKQAAAQDEAYEPKAFEEIKVKPITEALDSLAAEHEQAARTYRLVCVAGAWQFVTQPEYGPWLKAMVGHRLRPSRLSKPALETLAIIAYRQPLTRAEIEEIRGVAVDGVMQTLMERELVEQTGRADVVGRPALYGTTTRFLEYFGLRAITDLPDAEELRRLPVTKPATPPTAEPAPIPDAVIAP
ncbi:MAG: SMC-Scp complex subunit ScpB [Pedosphaera sp.]|nr:SMC-Scp complex subunit ScpB [Pedosphaera sp.]